MSLTSTSFLHRLVSGPDDVTWTRLTQLYTPLLHGWLGSRLPQAADVEDVTQEVFRVVLQKVVDFKHNGHPGAFRKWLHCICINCVRAFYQKRSPTSLDPEVLREFEDPCSPLNQRWDREHDELLLARALELIRPEFKETTWEAFHRVARQGEKADAVAGELGLSVNAVFIAKSRVMVRLREEVEGLL
jgi:RNA polymerase sigma-70 factor (ECF subfamily)